MTDLSCTDYTEKSIVVRGDTKAHKEELKKLGGKYNANLKDGAGWIFSKKSEDKVLSYIASGKLDDEKKEKLTKSKSTSSSNIDILSVVENHIKSLDLKERLAFINNVARMASNQPYLIIKDKITEVKVNVRKVKQEEEEEEEEEEDDEKRSPPTKLLVNSDIEDSEDEFIPKRLLQRPHH